MLRVASVLVLLAMPFPAFADRADADQCAQKLSGLALQTYQASIVRAQAGQTLRQAISAHLKPLVEASKISEDEAHKSGFSAAMCVRLVHRK
ncbi:hypothetical protein IZ6_29730 [Terrihabitans soli]|uniref:Uncharacterized protein n=1 Tax=Terrihabitans soli TaxID=708113 RepID=A0A6S6QZW0_9HYPH|nr:hypothetical protein [Terrihabitans soli]BCJ92238.1 hypothetical protein IZ6_29730 [Terrihabitans soli]